MSLILRSNICCSVNSAVVEEEAAALTVIRALASAVPPSPLAVRRYVVESPGVILREPVAGTLPRSSMFTEEAFCVFQRSSADCPRSTVDGVTVRSATGDAVAAVAAGEGAGGAALVAVVLCWHPAISRAKTMVSRKDGNLGTF